MGFRSVTGVIGLVSLATLGFGGSSAFAQRPVQTDVENACGAKPQEKAQPGHRWECHGHPRSRIGARWRQVPDEERRQRVRVRP